MKKLKLRKLKLKFESERVRELIAEDLKQAHGGYASGLCIGNGGTGGLPGEY